MLGHDRALHRIDDPKPVQVKLPFFKFAAAAGPAHGRKMVMNLIIVCMVSVQ
jgi:hypothetical protein